MVVFEFKDNFLI